MRNYHTRVLELVTDQECIDDKLKCVSDLMERDVLYIVYSKPDDNNFKHATYSEYSEWSRKLRGRKLGPVYLQNSNNSGDWFRGFIYSPTEPNVATLENYLIFDIIQGDITVEKIDLVAYRNDLEKKQNEHIDTLFSIG